MPLACLALMASFGPTAPPQGYRLLGFDAAGAAVVRHVDTGAGIDRAEVFAPDALSGELVTTVPVGLEPGVPGPVSADGSAAVVVRARRVGLRAGVDIARSTALGFELAARIEAPCDSSEDAWDLEVTVAWPVRPGPSRVAFVSGVFPPCEAGAPRFARAVPVPEAIAAGARERLSAELVAEATPPDFDGPQAGARTVLLVAALLDPQASLPWVLLARSRLLAGDPGGATAALWQLARSTTEGAPEALAMAVDSPWAAELRPRAAFRALRATTPPLPGAVEPPLPAPDLPAPPGE